MPEITLNKVPLANAIKAARAGFKVYGEPLAITENEIRLAQSGNYFHDKKCKLLMHDGDYYIAEINFPTRVYLQHGQWNPDTKERNALSNAKKQNPLHALTERDVLRDCPLQLADHSRQFANSPNVRARFQIKYGALALFLHHERIAPGQKPRDTLYRLAQSFNFPFTDCGEFQTGVRKIRFGCYNIYLPIECE